MSDHNQRVEPAQFEPATAAAGEDSAGETLRRAPTKRGSSHNNWVLPGLAALTVLAILVFFWLPSQVDSDSIDVSTAEQAAAQRSKPQLLEASPWSDAQLARQRKDAQAILAALLEVQFSLEETSVELWASEEFDAAQALATKADELYRQQSFLEASENYQAALDAMQAILGKVDEVFSLQLELGLSALRTDQAEAAINALELAVILKPDNPEANAGLARARNLEPLLELLLEANDARDQDRLEDALSLLRQATSLDPEHAGAAAQLAGVQRDIARRDFNRAMTAGYQALDEELFDEAERQFIRASRILPAAAETESALVQTRSARTRVQIDAWGNRARAAADREDWGKAVAAYEEILKIDSSVVFARAGLIESKARDQLDRRLKIALAKPERLSNEQVYRDTRAMYQQALIMEKKGPLLRAQLLQLDELLDLALKPIAVLLQSDEQTDVTVYKVSHLGTFRRQQLSLKPGVYTAVGVRSGYRDVRKKFTVSHSQKNPIIEISCTEPI